MDMEIIGTFVYAFASVSIVMQIGMAYTFQGIADKNDLSSISRFMAWIPILQVVPMIQSAGASVGKTLLGLVACMIGFPLLIGLGSTLPDPFGGIATFLGIMLMVLGMFGFMGWLAWRTAERRDLSGGLGLLVFIPFFGMFIYPYIAFHDGFVAPNKAGAALGTLLIIAMAALDFIANRGDAD